MRTDPPKPLTPEQIKIVEGSISTFEEAISASSDVSASTALRWLSGMTGAAEIFQDKSTRFLVPDEVWSRISPESRDMLLMMSYSFFAMSISLQHDERRRN